jgi:hypothetical protein
MINFIIDCRIRKNLTNKLKFYIMSKKSTQNRKILGKSTDRTHSI